MTTTVSDEIRAKRRAYYLANKERHLAQAKAWRLANPERYKELVQAHRERDAERRKPEQAERDGLKLVKRELRERRMRAGYGSLYVLTHPKHPGFVKIGRSLSARGRLTTYNAGCPDRAYEMPVVVEATRPIRAERRAHESLATCRHHGEWFRCSVVIAEQAVRRAVAPSVFD